MWVPPPLLPIEQNSSLNWRLLLVYFQPPVLPRRTGLWFPITHNRLPGWPFRSRASCPPLIIASSTHECGNCLHSHTQLACCAPLPRNTCRPIVDRRRGCYRSYANGENRKICPGHSHLRKQEGVVKRSRLPLPMIIRSFGTPCALSRDYRVIAEDEVVHTAPAPRRGPRSSAGYRRWR